VKHAERCVIWQSPLNAANIENSMVDAYVSMPPGKMLVYHTGTMGAPDKVRTVAATIAGRLNGALVSWPGDPAGSPHRLWYYAIQKQGKRT